MPCCVWSALPTTTAGMCAILQTQQQTTANGDMLHQATLDRQHALSTETSNYVIHSLHVLCSCCTAAVTTVLLQTTRPSLRSNPPRLLQNQQRTWQLKPNTQRPVQKAHQTCEASHSMHNGTAPNAKERTKKNLPRA